MGFVDRDSYVVADCDDDDIGGTSTRWTRDQPASPEDMSTGATGGGGGSIGGPCGGVRRRRGAVFDRILQFRTSRFIYHLRIP